MMFCGFTNDEIDKLIRFESAIKTFRKDDYKKPIMETYWIIGKTKNLKIFENIDDYMYSPNSKSSTMLLLSETLAIIDEAFFLTYSQKLQSYNAFEEILNMADETPQNWLFYEFKNRLEYICRCANNIIDDPRNSLFKEKINILYDNEMQACLKRWQNIVNVSVKNFTPYTKEYFIGRE